MNTPACDDTLARLSRISFWAIFGVALVIFFFASGPIWHHPWDIEEAVFLSYAPILPLVFCALVLEKKSSWRAFGLDSMALVLLKFGVTVSTATLLWATAGPPPVKPVAHARVGQPLVDAASLLPPTEVDPAQTGTLEVALAANSPTALVYVRDGLDHIVFATPEPSIEINNGGGGYQPNFFSVRVRQSISVRSTNHVLHTFLAQPIALGTAAPHTLFNVPALASGVANQVVFTTVGLATLTCTVHENKEAPAFASVRAHPFSQRLSPGGVAVFSGVPVGKLTVGAFAPGRPEASASAEVLAGQTVRVDLAP